MSNFVTNLDRRTYRYMWGSLHSPNYLSLVTFLMSAIIFSFEQYFYKLYTQSVKKRLDRFDYNRQLKAEDKILQEVMHVCVTCNS